MNQINNNSKGTRILSASRRTDIPAFYLDWFMDRIHRGSFKITNPYNKITKTIDARPCKIHTIVFWSKNYDKLLKSSAIKELNDSGYNLFFHFSINSESILEPEIPPLKERFIQLKDLCEKNKPENIAWRFDPVCYYQLNNGDIKNNLSDFETIAEKAASFGIKTCTTSFFDNYRKIGKRVKYLKNKGVDVPELIDINMAGKINIIKRMSKLLKKNNIKLLLCSEKKVLLTLRSDGTDDEITGNVSESACIDGKLFARLFKGEPDLKRDYGQRSKQGCKCTKSVDIGSYQEHPCFHNCLFCYANPLIDGKI